MIDQFSNPSKEVSRQAKDMEKRFDQMGKTFKNVGAVFDSVGSTLSKTVTAPIVTAGAASMAAFSEVDSALDTITQKTGATGEAMKGFQQSFENVATTVPADMDSVGAAIGEINTRLGLTGKPLEDATSKFLKFAELNGTNVESSIQTVTRAMGDAGIAAEDYGSVLDQLNVAGQMSGIAVDKLAENMAKYGAPMRALGLDTETSIAMFAGWEKAGVNTEIAFSGMKKAISNWGKEGKDAGIEFSKTIQQIKDAPDIASATSMAIEAFGSKAGPDLADAIKGGRFEVDDYIKALQNAGGSVEKTFAGTEDGVDKFKTAANAAKIALADFGGIISEAVGPILDKVTVHIRNATEWFRKLDDGTKQNIVKFAAIAAAVGPALIAFGKVSSGIGGMISNYGKLSGSIAKITGGFSGFSGVLTGPVGIAIAAAVAGAVLIYKNWDKIGPIVSKIGGRFQEFWNNVEPILGPFMKECEKVASFFEDVFGVAFDVTIAGISAGLVGLFESADEIIGNFLGIFDGIITFLDGVFTGNWEKAWTGLRDIVSNTFGSLEGLVKTPINAVINVVNGAIEKINGIKFTVPEWVPVIGGKGWKGLDIPTIPTLAKGTDNWRGGIVQISERGGEIVDLPKGSRVYPHDESVAMARAEGKHDISINIAKLADSIVVREDADIDRIAEAIVRKAKEASYNMA